MRWPWTPKPIGATGVLEPTSVTPAAELEAPPRKPGRVFGVSIDTGVLYGLTEADAKTYAGLYTPQVPRELALTVPAILRAREIIAGGIGQLPLRLLDQTNTPRDAWLWLTTEPEEGVPRSVTMAQLVEDMMFYRAAWLLELPGTYGRGKRYRRLDPATVTVIPENVTTAYGTYEKWPDTPGLVRIDSPTRPMLRYGARAITALARLEAAALNISTGVPPVDWFEVTDGFALSDEPGSGEDPDNPDLSEIEVFLNDWRDARLAGSTAYIPPGLAYKTGGFNPEQLQLKGARDHAITEISRLTGIDPEDLSVSISSKTYFNAQDRERSKVKYVLGPYMRAIEDRFSMPDITPVGYRVAFDLTDFLRADDQTAAAVDQTLISSKVMTVDEIRGRRGLPPLEAPETDQNTEPAAPAATDEGDAA